MQAGKVVRTFSAKDGRKVVLRTPKWEDLEYLLELINSLVEEGAEIIRNEKVSRKEEIDWLSKTLASLEKDEIFFFVAEVDGKVIASSDIRPLRGFERHVGVLGIIVKSGFRDIGIGAEMMKTLERASKMDLKVLTLSAFATNKRAIHVYETVGFVQTGVVPRKHFKDGRYIDAIIMIKLLE